jgi:hypothetical protein
MNSSGSSEIYYYVLRFTSNAANYTLVILDHSLIFRVTIPDAASIQFSLPMMGI